MSTTPRVVLLMSSFAEFDRGLLRGIARYTQLHGPWEFHLSGDDPVPIVDSDSTSGDVIRKANTSGTRRKTSLALRHLGATGVVGRIRTPSVARMVLASGLPTIAIDLSEEQLSSKNPLSNVSEICADSENAGRIAAEHFLERGFTQFAFCGYRGRIWSQRRHDGFAERLKASQSVPHVYEPQHRKLCLPWCDERPLLISWLRSLPKPIAIMACNDIRGRQVIEACWAAALRVPDDVAVLGVDEDRLLCDLANPPLSSVALNLERAGYQAAELLDGLMSGQVRAPRRILADALWVVQRHSTNVVAMEDRDVAIAARYVRDHFRQAITVDDVVREGRISRRSLEIRFQRSLGLSIRQEIQRARLAWSKKLLLETGLSAEKIAELSGFSSVSYLSSVFQREVGITLTEYRRQSRNP